MREGGKPQGWALVKSGDYSEELQRLSSKHRSQVARKAMDLMVDPRPGGSKSPLVGYYGLCRLRAGDYRIIYAYDDKVVQLLTLRRRAENTYDDLDDIEVLELEGFRTGSVRKAKAQHIVEWEELAKEWAAPKPMQTEQLPSPIVEAMLQELDVPPEYWPPLLALTTYDGLLDCGEVPSECRYKVLERLCPRQPAPVVEAQPVVVVGDLVDPKAAEICGPIVASPAVDDDEPSTASSGVPDPLVVVSTKELDPMKSYSGNVAKGIARDASYTVKLDGSVQLLYHVDDREYALLTTDDHPDLVKLVNEAKRNGGASSGGGR